MLWLALAGCLPFGLGADETDGFAPAPDLGDTGASGGAVPVAIADFVSAPAGVDAIAGLVAHPEAGAVDVEHVLLAPCGSDWDGASVVDTARELAVTYDRTADTASDACLWVLTYRIENVPPGAWTVTAEGASASVTVADR
jgi:hypothetical protein